MAPETLVKLTYEDYAAIPDDGRRHEIIDGEHYVNPAPGTKHQLVSVRLLVALYSHVTSHKLGHVFHAPFDVVLSEHNIVEPDLIYVSNDRTHIITKKNIQGSPNLLVEILSEWHPQHDTRVKYQTYESHGVAEYWIVDPEREMVNVYRLAGSRYQTAEVGDSITTPLLPGFSLAVRDLFVDL